MAGVYFLAWLLRLSVLVNFISESILTGFKAGAALVIASTQLPKLFGVPGGGDDFFERVWLLVRQLPLANGASLAIGVAALALLVVGARLLPGRPVSLAVVLLSILAVAIGHLDRFGVRIVGEIPAGLPQVGWAAWDLGTVQLPEARQLVRLASACFLLSYIESVSAARICLEAPLRHRRAARTARIGIGEPAGGAVPGVSDRRRPVSDGRQ
jgi:MFS superfamily sulfate permease-like transporter